ncbi:adenosine deaminase [Neiella holothuriorum]|nr:adenosine deaminase [Neiella holothuriorum]
MDQFLAQLPKVELHLHIEGTLEPEMMFALAERNGIALPYRSPEALREAYQFDNLQSFLDLYYQGAAVLRTRDDFYDLAMAYFKRCDQEQILHYEIMFDPQTHLNRGVRMNTMMEGLVGAQQDAQRHYGASSNLILSLLRHLPEEDGIAALEQAKPWQHLINAIGLDSSERGNPPSKFKRAFELADSYGWHRVAHAGEEGPADYIWEALRDLQVRRIDHGVRCQEDAQLVEYLIHHQVPLTVCPLSNVRLGVYNDLRQHNLKQLLELGLCVTLNSDDPAYFGGYLTTNMLAVQNALKLSETQWIQLTTNAINASFAPVERKMALKQRLTSAVVNYHLGPTSQVAGA